jgi:biopolymer transport protein ExbD
MPTVKNQTNKEAADSKCELSMTPMIDVTFQLLIFFLCTIKFKTLEGKLGAYLPKDVGINTKPADPLEKVEIKIEVEREGKKVWAFDDAIEYVEEEHGRHYFFSGRSLKYSVGPRVTKNFNELKRWLREQVDVARQPDGSPRPVGLDPRSGVVNEEVVKVLDAAWEAGFTEITFVGSYEKS